MKGVLFFFLFNLQAVYIVRFSFFLVYIVFEASVTFGSEGKKGMWQIANS